MTARQRQLRRKYTRIVKVGRANWQAFFRGAKFMSTMVAKAIERLQTDLHDVSRLLAAVVLAHGGALDVYRGDLVSVTPDMVVQRIDHDWGVTLKLRRE